MLTISLTPGKVWEDGDEVTVADLNQAANPTVELEGSVNSTSVADGAITTAKLADNALAASAAGRAKMQDGFFDDDATSRAKFAADFFGTDATSRALFADGFFARYAPVIASSRNLIAQRASNSTLTLTADEMVLKNSNSSPYMAQAVNLTLNIASAGANGLDTGAEANDTWYYFWVIWNGTTVAGLLSTSSSAPTMPGGYTHKGLAGAVRNDSAGNFVVFYQQDRDVWLNDTNVFTGKAVAVGGTYESYSAGGGGSDVNLATLIPPNAIRLRGTCGCSVAGANESMAIAADANGLGAVTVAAQSLGSALGNFASAAGFDIPLKTAQTFFWKALDTNTRNRVNISGYRI